MATETVSMCLQCMKVQDENGNYHIRLERTLRVKWNRLPPDLVEVLLPNHITSDYHQGWKWTSRCLVPHHRGCCSLGRIWKCSRMKSGDGPDKSIQVSVYLLSERTRKLTRCVALMWIQSNLSTCLSDILPSTICYPTAHSKTHGLAPMVCCGQGSTRPVGGCPPWEVASRNSRRSTNKHFEMNWWSITITTSDWISGMTNSTTRSVRKWAASMGFGVGGSVKKL